MKHLYHVFATRHLGNGASQCWHGIVLGDAIEGDPNQWYTELLQGVTTQLDLMLPTESHDDYGPVIIQSLTNLGAQRHAPVVDTRNP